MNGAALALGAEAWKPLLTALALPPVPWLVLVLVGAACMPRRRAVAGALVLLACTGLWLGSTTAAAEWLAQRLLAPPPAVDLARESAQLRDPEARAVTAVVVLGGGRDRFAPEYGAASLSARSLERLRYGVWLGRRLAVPVAFSGGVGHGAGGAAGQGDAEAEVAARIAADEFGHALRWQESTSRDTRENAALTLPLLARDGVRRVLIVTHAWHMPRAQRAFRDAAFRQGTAIEIVPAPIALARRQDDPVLRWLPSSEGALLMRDTLREWLGRLAGA